MKLQRGDRAVVTGASYGIGEAFARLLAARGIHVVMIARSSDRLHALAADLGDVGVTVIPTDLATLVPAGEQLGRVDLLVNNAGFGAFGRFDRVDGDVQTAMIDVNVRALVSLTQTILPGMLERRRGAILNVASVAGFQAFPYMSVYSATKAFVIVFSRALRAECARRGITVTALCPGSTRTRFHEIAGGRIGPQPFTQSPEEVARAGIAAVEAGRGLVVPGWFNLIAMALSKALPAGLMTRAMERLYAPGD